MKAQREAPLLFADDDENDRYFFKLALEQADVCNPLVMFAGGQELIDYLQGMERRFPSLLVLDLKMPRVSGFDVLEWIRARPGLAGFPVVVLSASQQETDIKRALELGATEYKVKPPDFGKLAEFIIELRERWLTQGRPEAQLTQHAGQRGSWKGRHNPFLQL